MNGSKHFSLDAWADFVRDVGDSEVRDQMQRHLAMACRECLAAHSLFVRVLRAARGLVTDPVPAEWSVEAENIMQRATLQSLLSMPVRFAVAQPPQRPLEAVRSDSQSGSHAIFRSDECDIALEAVRAGNEDILVGQILDSTGGPPPGSLPVFLFQRSKLLAAATANEFGEFRLSCPGKPEMSVSFPFKGYRIELPLGDWPALQDL